MTHSMYCDRKQKRENECDDLDNHTPSAKRMKFRNSRDQESNNTNDQNATSYSSSENNSSFPVSHKDHNMFQASQVSHAELQRSSVNCNDTAQTNYVCVSENYSDVCESDLKYLPALSAVENPFYYENNRLLFELYVERIHRTATSTVSSSSSQQSF